MPYELRPTKPFEHRRLPREHDLPHAVAVYFHDILAALVVDLEVRGALRAPVTLTPEESEEIAGLQGEALWSWLQVNGYEDVVADLTYRDLTAALAADACHFILESLLTCAKGKTTVAFALLRKPFKENLLLLEWLCADAPGFLQAFHGTSPEDYVLSGMDKEKQRGIVRTACQSLEASPLPDAEFLYDVRYTRREPYSLDRLWNKAAHLVTTFSHVQTEPGNVNFVFSTPSAIDEQWAYYYTVVPALTAYFVAVTERVVERFVSWDEEKRAFQGALRAVALARAGEVVSGQPSDDLDGLLTELGGWIDATCAGCKRRVEPGRADADRLWNAAEVECPECGGVLDLWAHQFGDEPMGCDDGT